MTRVRTSCSRRSRAAFRSCARAAGVVPRAGAGACRAVRLRRLGRAPPGPLLGAARTVRVSVVMPVRDGERFLVESVESVLAQTEPDLELVVVDDGSTDSTPRLLAGLTDPRVRVLTQPPLGLTAALDAGCAAAAAPVIA